MPVKIIGLIRLKDAIAFETYRSQVGATVARYQGTVAARGKVTHLYWDQLPTGGFGAFVELQFPSADAAARWAESPEYQALLAVRAQAMDLTLFQVED